MRAMQAIHRTRAPSTSRSRGPRLRLALPEDGQTMATSKGEPMCSQQGRERTSGAGDRHHWEVLHPWPPSGRALKVHIDVMVDVGGYVRAARARLEDVLAGDSEQAPLSLAGRRVDREQHLAAPVVYLRGHRACPPKKLRLARDIDRDETRFLSILFSGC